MNATNEESIEWTRKKKLWIDALSNKVATNAF
jgi:hypothetical protein